MDGKIDTSWLSFAPTARFALEPDPAWDLATIEDDELVVELSWLPDALAGRLGELVASPALAAALRDETITGVAFGTARGVMTQNAFVEPGAPTPPLVRLIVGRDQDEDLSYSLEHGLVASPRAVALIAGHCARLSIKPSAGRA